MLVGARAVLLRGPSGAGKSRLALELIEAAAQGLLPFARLVADDRTLLQVAHGQLLARPVPVLAGLIEVRGLGLRRLGYEAVAVIGQVVDLGEPGERLPSAEAASVTIEGVTLPRLAFPACNGALAVLVAALRTAPADGASPVSPAAAQRHW